MLTKSRKGFTLLEVLVATLLVGLGIFAIMEAFNRGYLGAGQVEDYTLAISLSQEQIETVRATPFSSISSQARAPVPEFSSFERATSVTTVHPDLKKVVVTTYWKVPNGENNVSLTTYAANA